MLTGRNRKAFPALVCGLAALTLPQMAAAASLGAADAGKAKVVISSKVEAGQAGQSSASNTFRVRASVPMACWVRPDRNLIAETGLSGEVVEACNNPGGFTVTANYRPLEASEKAEFFYDNQAVVLGSGGMQRLRYSPEATVKRVNYRFGEIAVNSPLTLSLVIQPI